MKRSSLKRPDQKSRLSGKCLLLLSASIGMATGFCFWWFISRCEEPDCYYHFVPFVEMFVGAFSGGGFAMVHWDDRL